MLNTQNPAARRRGRRRARGRLHRRPRRRRGRRPRPRRPRPAPPVRQRRRRPGPHVLLAGLPQDLAGCPWMAVPSRSESALQVESAGWPGPHVLLSGTQPGARRRLPRRGLWAERRRGRVGAYCRVRERRRLGAPAAPTRSVLRAPPAQAPPWGRLRGMDAVSGARGIPH